MHPRKLLVILTLYCISSLNSFEIAQKMKFGSPLGLGASMLVGLTSAGIFWNSGSTIFDTVNDIPKTYFKENKVISASVVKITDGDTIR